MGCLIFIEFLFDIDVVTAIDLLEHPILLFGVGVDL